MRGVSDLARMTPAAVEAKYGVPPARYPELAAIVGETSDNLPGVPGVGPGLRRQVDQPVRRPRQRHHPRRRDHRQEGRGAARAPRRRDPQPPAQRAGPRPRPRARARPTWRCGRGTGRRCTPSSTASSSGCCATGSSRPSVRGGRSTTPASSWPGAARRRRGGRLAGRARRPGASASASHVAGQLGRRHRRGLVGRARGRRRHAPRWVDAAEVTPEDDAALAAWLADPTAPQGAARRQGPDAGARPPGAGRWRGWSATPRSRRTSSGPTSAPTTSPT